MSEPYIWHCSFAECQREAETLRHRPPAGWVWVHFYSERLKGPTSCLACCEEHGRRAAKRLGRLTKLEVVQESTGG